MRVRVSNWTRVPFDRRQRFGLRMSVVFGNAFWLVCIGTFGLGINSAIVSWLIGFDGT